jgi:hypothetical protein
MAKKRKTKRRRPNQNGHSQGERPPELRLIGRRSPWSSLSPKERDAVAQHIGDDGSRRFDDAFAELRGRLTQFEPLSLLAGLSIYQLTLPAGRRTPRIGREPLHQHHAELLQALILQHPQTAFAWMPTFPDLPGLVDLVDLASRMFFVRRIGPAADRQDGERRRVQEGIRLETQSVRNWGYPHQMRRITVDLFAPLDERIDAAIGVRAVDLIEMWQRIVELAYQRIAEHLRRVQPIARAGSISALCQAFTETENDAPAIEATLIALNPGINLPDAKEQLLHWFHLHTPDIYTFTLDDFATAYPNPIDRVALRSVLGLWSLSFGALADRDPEHFFLDNPIWTRPLIELADDRFFCPIPDLIQSFGLRMMEALIRDYPALWEAYGHQRGRFLEDETARLFAVAFPSASMFRGSTWRDPENPTDEWENDLLVLLDAYAIVVEAKAGRVADRAAWRCRVHAAGDR